MPDRRGIGLRGRLTAFFIVITVLPVLVAVLALQVQIDQQLGLRSEAELGSVRRAAVALIAAERARAGDFASDLIRQVADSEFASDLGDEDVAEEIQAFLEQVAESAIPVRADVAAILDADGVPLAMVGRDPQFPAASVTDAPFLVGERVVGETTPDGDVPSQIEVAGALAEVRGLQGPASNAIVAYVVTLVWTDDALLDGLGIAGNAALVRDGQVLAATGDDEGGLPEERSETPGQVATVTEADGDRYVASAPLAEEGETELVVWTRPAEQPSSAAVALLIVVPAVLLAAIVGYVLASAVVGPVRRAANVARAVAGGDLTRHLEPTGGPELADLSDALNRMSAELAARLRELEDREEALRGSLERLGQTLSSSLDLNRTLSVVVDTAMETLRADRALLALFTPARDALYTKVGRGLEGEGPRIRLGEGLVGTVAERATPVLLPAPEDAVNTPKPAEVEPIGASQLAVPLLVRGRVLGVLSLLRDDEDHLFTPADLETVRSFATQASVAIENVMLHQEAQRLSVTDPLTGLWNFRYFQLQADRELGSAERSGRPLALIVVDIDHFKPVNDTYGHQVGDEILVEVARRLQASTRVPDVVARYGGEEFVVLLPDTDLEGAASTAERIRESIRSETMKPELAGVTATTGAPEVGPLVVTCSVGVASQQGEGTTVASLLRAADAAMYQAKEQGRDRVVLSSA